jgi:hypothetical protein
MDNGVNKYAFIESNATNYNNNNDLLAGINGQ